MTKPHRKNRSIRLDDDEWATLRDDLGIGWLRAHIEQAKARKAQSYLLEALEGLVSLFPEGVDDGSAGLGFNKNLKQKYRAAVTAIAKARGEP